MYKEFIICLVVCIITCDVKAEYKQHTHNELPCILSGGICVQSGDCQKENLSPIKGLCPVQQEYGTECCHGLPKSATQCHQRGGECFPNSYRCATETKATDCADDQICCILI